MQIVNNKKINRKRDIMCRAFSMYSTDTKSRKAYMEGAAWADKNPDTPWNDVKESRPKGNTTILVMDWFSKECKLSHVDSAGNMMDFNERYKLVNINVDYWMYVPKIKE